MEIDVIGVGAAYEPVGVNSSLLVKESDYQLLIDCGPTVPPALWRRDIGINEIDAIYFTHCHPDHCLGLTTLINYWQSKKRNKNLVIFAQPQQWKQLQALVAFGIWPDDASVFQIHWQDSTQVETLGPWQTQVAPSNHSVTNLSLNLRSSHGLLFYSGDGRPSPETLALLADADIIFQECQSSVALAPTAHHGDLPDCLALERKPTSLLCPYHIGHEHLFSVVDKTQALLDVVVPRDGTTIKLHNGEWTFELINKDVLKTPSIG